MENTCTHTHTYISKKLLCIYTCVYMCLSVCMNVYIYTHEKITWKCMAVKGYLNFEAMFLKYKP